MINKNRPKIYDCFMFFNELDLLEIRLSELYNYVDYFVIVESPITHSGKDKPLYYWINRKRYSKWTKKIIHIVCPPIKKNLLDKIFALIEIYLPYKWVSRAYIKFNLGRRKVEVFQRNYTMNALKNARPDDIILIGDVDEIPRKSTIQKIRKILKESPESVIRLSERLFYYYLNGSVEQKWESSKACNYFTLKNRLKNPDYLRNWSPIYKFLSLFNYRPILHKEKVINDAGWHFSYLGGVNAVMEKISSISHFENDSDKLKSEKNIKEMMNKGDFFYRTNRKDKIKYIKINKRFPAEIWKNKKKYAHLIMDKK